MYRYFAMIKLQRPESQELSQLAHIVGPLTARQLYTISMAYRWRAVGGALLCASWEDIL